MKKREIFLYFAQPGKASNFDNPHGFDHPTARGGHVVTSTEVSTTWSGATTHQDIPISELFNGASKGVQASITRVSVKSASDNTGNRGSAYAATTEVPGGRVAPTPANTVAGQITVLLDAAYPDALAGSAGSELLRIEKTGASGTAGYNLQVGDEVRVERALTEGEAVVYPADMYIGCQFVNDTTTRIHFNSMKGEEFDDMLTVTHDAGKFKEVANLMKACAESNPYKAGMIKVIDLFNDPDIIAGHDADDLGITNLGISIAAN